jgi:hypothetical protein
LPNDSPLSLFLSHSLSRSLLFKFSANGRLSLHLPDLVESEFDKETNEFQMQKNKEVDNTKD